MLRHSGFCALRAPLLDIGALASWWEAADPGAALRALVARPEVRDAIAVASPDLDARLDAWLAGADEPSVAASAARYVVRMASRPTPFGLFAAVTSGAISDATEIDLDPVLHGRSRLDAGLLGALVERLAARPDVRARERFRANPTLFETAGRVHYVEARGAGAERTHHLVAAPATDELRAVLAAAGDGAAIEALVEAIAAAGDRLEAEAYVHSLVDAQVLTAELAVALTGGEPGRDLPRALRERGRDAEAALVDAAHAILVAADRAPAGERRERMRELREIVAPLAPGHDPAEIVQVDARRGGRVRLGQEDAAEVVRAAELLRRLTPGGPAPALARFVDRFDDRYEGAEVPLAEVLDDEAGLGFDDPRATVEWGAREAWLLERIVSGAREIDLSEADVAALERTPPPMPPALSVTATLAASGDVVATAALGPSGARLLGRFCHGDDALRAAVEAHLRAEEALDGEAIHAEVVHAPRPRAANVVSRPVLRPYEIVLGPGSGVPAERRLPLADLLVSVRDGEVVLRSARLGRRVLPRLTCAHDPHRRPLPAYRFLAMLQAAGGIDSFGFAWGALESSPFTPRVRSGRVVLARATWRITAGEVATRADLPRWVRCDGLLVDRASTASVAAWRDGPVRQRVRVEEAWPEPGDLLGGHAHEIVVPLVRTTPARVPRMGAGPARRFAPGSEWTFAKLYCGHAGADRLLGDVVAPLAEDAELLHALRYSDPEHHLRVRVRGDARGQIDALAAPALADGRCWRVAYDTYVPETARYGGPAAIEVAERIFDADTRSALELMALVPAHDGGHALRWQLAVASVNAWADAAGIEDEVLRAAARTLGAEQGVPGRALAGRFRAERAVLEAVLWPSAHDPIPRAREILARRDAALHPLLVELRGAARTCTYEEAVVSLVHLSVNRLLRSDHRRQERVLYDFVARLRHGARMRA